MPMKSLDFLLAFRFFKADIPKLADQVLITLLASLSRLGENVKNYEMGFSWKFKEKRRHTHTHTHLFSIPALI